MNPRTVTKENLEAGVELAQAIATLPARSGWRIEGAKDFPSLTLTVTDVWRSFPDAVLERCVIEKLLYYFIREALWFNNWTSAAAWLTDAEYDLWFPKKLSPDALIGLDAISGFLKDEAVKEIAWWRHTSGGKEYGFRIDFEAALSLFG